MPVQLSRNLDVTVQIFLFVTCFVLCDGVCHLPVLIKVLGNVSEFCCLWDCAINTQLWQMAPLLHTNTYSFHHPSFRRSSTPLSCFLWGRIGGAFSGLMYGATYAGSRLWPSSSNYLTKQTCASSTVLWINVVKNSIARCSEWAHLTVTVQRIYVLEIRAVQERFVHLHGVLMHSYRRYCCIYIRATLAGWLLAPAWLPQTHVDASVFGIPILRWGMSGGDSKLSNRHTKARIE